MSQHPGSRGAVLSICPACSSTAVEFIPEACGDVCTECGYTVDVVVLDGSQEVATGHIVSKVDAVTGATYRPGGGEGGGSGNGAGGMRQGTNSWWSSQVDKEDQRRIREQVHLSEIHAFIKGTLIYLHRQRYTERAFGLFDVVRRAATERTKKLEELWKTQQAALGISLDPAVSSSSTTVPEERYEGMPWRRKAPNRLFTWGFRAKSLAVACIYSTIYTAEWDSVISLEEVIHACGEAASHRSLSFKSVVKRLRLVRQYGGEVYAHVKEDAPRFYIPAMLDFFEALVDGDNVDLIGASRSSGKGKARVIDDAIYRVRSSLSDAPKFFDLVQIPLARTIAPELAHALEEANFPPPPQRAGSKMAVDGLASAWRETRMDMELTAYAIVMWAVEASARTAGPQQLLIELCRYARKGAEGAILYNRNLSTTRPKQAADVFEAPRSPLMSDESEQEDDEQDVKLDHDARITEAMPNSKTTLQWRYSNIRTILSDYAKHLPWVLSASMVASGRRVQMHSRSAYSKKMSAATIDADGVELNRNDIVTWMRDILAFRDAGEAVEADESLGRRLRRKTGQSADADQERWSRIANFTNRFGDDGSEFIGPDKVDSAPVDSNVVSRFKARLKKLVPEGATLQDPIETIPEEDIDQVLFDSDEDFESTYLRSDIERQLVEQKLRDEGGWELDEQRTYARETRERIEKEKRERTALMKDRKRKYDAVLAGLDGPTNRSGPDSKRQKRREGDEGPIAFESSLKSMAGSTTGAGDEVLPDGRAAHRRQKGERPATLQDEDILYTSSDEDGDESTDED